MIATIAASSGLNVSYNGVGLEGARTGGLLYSSPAAGIGYGERSDPNKLMPVWTPAPDAYNTRQDANANFAPKYRYDK